MEQAARTAETAHLAEEVELCVAEARLRAKAEKDAAVAADRERTEADRTSSAIKDLIAAAESAMACGGTAKGVAGGRVAAAELLTVTGSWTREAAEFALAGNDEDVLNWLDADRVLAQKADDRETVLGVARMSTAAIAEAAHTALASTDDEAPTRFLSSGFVTAGAETYRVRIFRVLNENPGPAVKAKAQAALDAGTAVAMHRFLSLELADAVKEDDNVEILRLLNTGGLYTKAAAQIALEGSAKMRRSFVSSGQFDAARLDHDHATHVSAVRAAVAHASKVALKALEDASYAQKAAAEARNAAQEATDWATKAGEYAKDADLAKDEARRNADAADASATKAAQSAATAKNAARTARAAAATANYAMSRALDSAREAVSF
ncbi:ALF repeat-containing protein, partial [Streptomyces sp. N35]|uniref:ALF repeat-containing protein n=1 Tax=Streptomyces sp. N35 TaxID=2795730 RepID=UPI0018F52737